MKWLPERWCEHRPIGHSSSRLGAKPDTIVLHYTTGGSYLDTIRWFSHPQCTSSSAHFVVGRRGQVVQLVPLDLASWHAGDGTGMDRTTNPNIYSIGIEIANHGRLEPSEDGWATDWGLEYDQRRYPDPIHGAMERDGETIEGMWEPYPAGQVGGVAVLCHTLVKTFNIPLNRIVGHQDLADHKIDPGPLWPWDDLYARVPGRPGDGTQYRRTL